MSKKQRAVSGPAWISVLERVSNGSKTAFYAQWQQSVQSAQAKPLVVFTPNPEQVVQAAHSPDFAATLLQADVLLPDGIGLLWARWWWKLANRSQAPVIMERIAGREVVQWWLQMVRDSRISPQQGRTFLVGGAPAVLEKVWEQFDPQRKWLSGSSAVRPVSALFTETASPEQKKDVELQNALVLKEIAQWRPAVVLVAFGAPWQEQWVLQYLPQLQQSGVKVVCVCGGALDMVAGRVSPAPALFTAFGLEWLWRLIQQPWRWRRQLRLVEFVRLVLFSR